MWIPINNGLDFYQYYYRDLHKSSISNDHLFRCSYGPLGEYYYIVEDFTMDLSSTVGDFIFTGLCYMSGNGIYGADTPRYYNINHAVYYNPTAKLWLYPYGQFSTTYYISDVFDITQRGGSTKAVYWRSDNAIVTGNYTAFGPSPPPDINIELKVFANDGWVNTGIVGLGFSAGKYEPFGSKVGQPNKYVGAQGYTYSFYYLYLNSYVELNGEFVFVQATSYSNSIYSGSGYIIENDKKYLWFDGSRWIASREAGVADSDIGYWKNTMATIPDTYTLVFTGEGTPPTPASFYLNTSSQTWDNEAVDVDRYYGKVAVVT